MAPRFPTRLARHVPREQGRDSRRRFHRTRKCLRFDCFPTVASSGCWSISTVWAIARLTASTLKTEIRKPIAASRFGNNGWKNAGSRVSFGMIRRPLFTDPTIVAYRLMGRLIEKQDSLLRRSSRRLARPRSVLCGPVGSGIFTLARICRSAAINIEPPAEFFCPSITGLNTPDLSDVFERSIEWFFDDNSWRGPHLMEPTESSLFEGESTGKPKVMV